MECNEAQFTQVLFLCKILRYMYLTWVFPFTTLLHYIFFPTTLIPLVTTYFADSAY